MKLLLDTHIWLWYALGDSKLSPHLQSLMSSATTELWISPISIWEVLILAEKNRIALKTEAVDWIDQSLRALKIGEASLTQQIAILSRQITLEHQDPADRFIAATAIHYQLKLATADTRLTEADWLSTIT